MEEGWRIRVTALCGRFATRANGGSVTPAFSDPHAGAPRSADRRCSQWSRVLCKVGQAGVSVKGDLSQKFQEMGVETLPP